MENKLDLFKLSSEVGLDNIEFRIYENYNHLKNYYNLKFELSSDYWNWNLTNPYLKCLKVENDWSELSTKSDQTKVENAEISFREEEVNKEKQVDLSSRYGNWDIHKGDYILPPPEIRFKKHKRILLLKILKELSQALILIPFIIFLTIYLLNIFIDK
jgi:hypothetical protein